MKQFTYRAMVILASIAILTPYAHELLVFAASRFKPEMYWSLRHLPFPLSYLQALGENPLYFGGYVPPINTVVRLALALLVFHRAFRILRDKQFVVPASFGGGSYALAFIGSFSILAAMALVGIAAVVPGLGALGFLVMPASIGMLLLPWAFTISEVFALKMYTQSEKLKVSP